MFETLLAYLIILAPSVITLIGALATVVCFINKIRKNSAETQATIAEAKATVEKIKASEDLKQMMATLYNENISLKKSLTLCTEEITRIHKLHPEWLEGGETDGSK
jgi:cell shape-determining protein MreC